MIYRKIAHFLGFGPSADLPFQANLSPAGGMSSGAEGEIITLPTARRIPQTDSPFPLQGNTGNICMHLGFIHREPVISRESQEVIGHELMLNNSSELLGGHPSPMLCHMHDELLLKSILAQDIPRILGDELAFIRISPASLNQALIVQLPAHNVVLAFSPEVKNADRLLTRCRELKTHGFRFSLDDFSYSPGLYPLLGLTDYLRFDLGNNSTPNIEQQLGKIPRLGEKTLIAKNVATPEVLANASLHAFRLYQGSGPVHSSTNTESSDNRYRAKIIVLMNMLKNHAETSEIEDAMKQSGALTFRVLRYINSPANGLRQEARSISEVLDKFGRNTLYRWLSLLLFCQETLPNHHNHILLENALLRGRLAELFGQCKLPAEEKADLFVTGMFSFLGHLFKTPLDKALSHLALSSPIKEALLHHSGPYVPFLKLALACENHDQAGIEHHAKIAGISVEQVNATYVKAVVWAHEIGR